MATLLPGAQLTSSPSGCKAGTWTQKMRKLTSMGTATRAPTAPHSQPQNRMLRKTTMGFSVQDLQEPGQAVAAGVFVAGFDFDTKDQAQAGHQLERRLPAGFVF